MISPELVGMYARYFPLRLFRLDHHYYQYNICCTLKWFQLQTNKKHIFIGRSCVQVAATKRCFLIIEWYRRMDRSCQVKHYKIEHSCTVVCWLDPRTVGREPVSDRYQDTYETCKTKGLLFGEQRNTLAIQTCMFNMPNQVFHWLIWLCLLPTTWYIISCSWNDDDHRPLGVTSI